MYLVQTLSTLLVPKGKKYNDGYDMDAVQQAIRDNLSVADVVSLYAFFLTKWVKSIKDSQTYLDKEIRKIPNKAMREKLMKQVQEMRSKINGVG